MNLHFPKSVPCFAPVKFSVVNEALNPLSVLFSELPVCSPLLQSVLKTMEKWEDLLQAKLNLFSGPPEEYIPGCYRDVNVSGPSLLRYKSMMEPSNTPFL